MASEQFSLCWDNFHRNMSMGMQSLLETEDLVDVTLAVEGKCLKAHKMVLSVCSPYFRELFQSNPCKHPIVFMKDVSYIALTDLLQFMYQGEVQVAQENLSTFIKTAEALQIKGLTGDSGVQNDIEVEDMEKPFVESSKRSHEDTKQTPTNRVKKLAGPASKRAKMSPVQSTPVRQSSTSFVSTGNKFEVASVNTNDVQTTEEAELKLEPEPNEQLESDMVNETQIEQYADDSNVDDVGDDVEDFSLMESSADEPKASTSTDAGGESQDEQEEAIAVNNERLPETSKERYKKEYGIFDAWRKKRGDQDVNEQVVLEYFTELSKTYKASSLWTRHSMLKATLELYENVDISKYMKVIDLLKSKLQDYVPKKAKALGRLDIEKFLLQSDDDVHLMNKVVLVLGIVGGCCCEELTKLRTGDIEYKDSYMMVSIATTKTGMRRSFSVIPEGLPINAVELCRRYASLRPAKISHDRFFLNYKNKRCTVQPVGIHTIAKIPSIVARFLNLPNPESYTGHSLRRSSVLGDRRWCRIAYL